MYSIIYSIFILVLVADFVKELSRKNTRPLVIIIRTFMIVATVYLIDWCY